MRTIVTLGRSVPEIVGTAVFLGAGVVVVAAATAAVWAS
jgi:hypothetical protein